MSKSKLKRIFFAFGTLAVLGAFFVAKPSSAAVIADNVKGRILLQVQQKGQAWYVNPETRQRHFLGGPRDAFNVMREQGLGITNEDIAQIPIGAQTLSGTDTDGDGLSDTFEDAIGTDKNNPDTDGDSYPDGLEVKDNYNPLGPGRPQVNNSLVNRIKGKILLQVQDKGEAWYLNPTDNQRYFLGRPRDAFEVMKGQGLGITDEDLGQVKESQDNKTCQIYPAQEFGAIAFDQAQTNQIVAQLGDITDQLKAKLADSSVSQSALQRLAQQRKGLLIQAMRQAPDRALAHILNDQERQQLTNVTDNCAEQAASLEGRLEVLHADDFDVGVSQTWYILVTADKQRINLYPAKGLRQALTSGMKLKVKGFRLDDNLLFDGTSSLDSLIPGSDISGFELVEPFATEPVLGEQKILVVLANFQDTPEPDLTPEEINDLVSNQANSYYQDNSYDLISLSGEFLQEDWLTVPLDQICNFTLFSNTLVPLIDPLVDWTEYSGFLAFAPFGPSPDCEWAGVAHIGKKRRTTQDGLVYLQEAAINTDNPSYGPTLFVVSHEWGHTLGLGHANFLDCNNVPIREPETDCELIEYGDLYSVMGSSRPVAGHFTSMGKDYLGWLSLLNIQTVLQDGTYTIEPIESPSSGVKVLKIPRKPDGFDLYIEYRQPIGFDVGLDKNGTRDVFEGALLHVFYDVPFKPVLFDPTPPSDKQTVALKVGDSFTDPVTTTTITTVSQTAEGLTLDIALGKTDVIRPEVTITFPEDGQTVSDTITVTAEAFDESGIEKVELYLTYLDQLLATDAAAPYEFQVDTTQIVNNDVLPFADFHQVWARAYDRSGEPFGVQNNTGDSEKVRIIVQNTDPVPPTISLESPLDGSSVLNPVTLSAQAEDNVGIWKVSFHVDGSVSDKAVLEPPYRFIQELSLGPHTVFAKAYDFVGNITQTPEITFTVVDELPTLKLGDVNADGQTDTTDADIILKYAVGLEVDPVSQARIDLGCGDVTKEGDTGGFDSLVIASYAEGIPTPFPVGREVCPLPAGVKPPTAKINASPLTGPSPLTVSFDGRSSTDLDGLIVDYYWFFDDSNAGNDGQATGSLAQHTFTETYGRNSYTYEVRLIVTDNDGATDTAVQEIVVTQATQANTSPRSPVELSQSPGLEGATTTNITPAFSFQISDPDRDQKIGYQVQLAKDVNFKNLVINYKWPGSTINPNNMTFNVLPNQALEPDSYWWRVRGTDETAAVSDWVYFGEPTLADFTVETAQIVPPEQPQPEISLSLAAPNIMPGLNQTVTLTNTGNTAITFTGSPWRIEQGIKSVKEAENVGWKTVYEAPASNTTLQPGEQLGPLNWSTRLLGGSVAESIYRVVVGNTDPAVEALERFSVSKGQFVLGSSAHGPKENVNIVISTPEWILKAVEEYFGLYAGITQGDLVDDRPQTSPYDTKWHWHMEPATITMFPAAIELCDGRASFVEKDIDYWVNSVGSWCPWGYDILSLSFASSGAVITF